VQQKSRRQAARASMSLVLRSNGGFLREGLRSDKSPAREGAPEVTRNHPTPDTNMSRPYGDIFAR